MKHIKFSRYINDKEEKFLDYCFKNNLCIKEVVKTNTLNKWEISFKPECLDSTEKRVIEYCKENQIKYTFFRDDGFHHYEFICNDDVPIDMNKNNIVKIDVQPSLRYRKKEQTPDKSIWSWFKNLLKTKEILTNDLIYQSSGINKYISRYDLLRLSFPFKTPEEFEKFYNQLIKEEQ
jgi:hypothetical protein